MACEHRRLTPRGGSLEGSPYFRGGSLAVIKKALQTRQIIALWIKVLEMSLFDDLRHGITTRIVRDNLRSLRWWKWISGNLRKQCTTALSGYSSLVMIFHFPTFLHKSLLGDVIYLPTRIFSSPMWPYALSKGKCWRRQAEAENFTERGHNLLYARKRRRIQPWVLPTGEEYRRYALYLILRSALYARRLGDKY